jgi:hypothetical protein
MSAIIFLLLLTGLLGAFDYVAYHWGTDSRDSRIDRRSYPGHRA